MKRIFLTLTLVGTVLLVAATVVGLLIGDPHDVSERTRKLLNYHVLTSVAALIFACLLHAVLLTYFMGTGRWLDETTQAYQLDPQWYDESRRLKQRTIPVMAGCIVLLILNIPLGALSDDRTAWTIPALGSVTPARVHLVFGLLTLAANVAVNVLEYRAIRRNGELIGSVVTEVRRIRVEKGLPV